MFLILCHIISLKSGFGQKHLVKLVTAGNGGYLVERWEHSRATENGSLFLPLRFCNRPLFFEKVVLISGVLFHFCLYFKNQLLIRG